MSEYALTDAPINSPLYHVTAGAIYKVNMETSASCVLMGDGTTVENRINMLARKGGACLFANSIEAMTNISASAGQLCLMRSQDTTALYVYTPEKVWQKLMDIGGSNG